MTGSAARALVVALSLGAAGCGEAKSTSDPAASASVTATTAAPPVSASASASAEPPRDAGAKPAASADELDPNTVAAEPERKTLRAVADDPALYENRDFVADKYGVVRLPFPLELQAVPLPRGRRAVLLTGHGPALDKPLILVVDTATNALLWSKDRVLAGTRERARELTLSRGPHGEVLVFWYDEPTRLVAAREWTHEGGIFADFQVMPAEGCDRLAVLYWPGHGWLAALAEGGALRVQYLGEGGTLQWSEPVSLPASPGAPAASARETRPKLAVSGGKAIEIALGARRVKLSPEGTTVK